MNVISAVKFVLRRCFAADRTLLLAYILLSIVLAILNALLVFYYKAVTDTATGSSRFLGLGIIGAVYLFLFYQVVVNLLEKLKEYIWNVFDIKQALHNNREFVDKLRTLDLPSFEDPQKNDIISRAFSRFQFQFKYYLKYFVDMVSQMVRLLFSMTFFILASPGVGLIVLLAHIFPIFIRSRLGEYTFMIYRADTELRRRFGYINDILTGRDTLPEVKIFCAFGYLKEKLTSVYKRFGERQMKSFKKVWWGTSLVELLPTISIFYFLLTAAYRLSNHQISAGTFMFLFLNIFIFSGSLYQTTNAYGSLVSDAPFIHDAMDFFDLKNTIVFPALKTDEKLVLIKKLRKPDIEFHDVSFKYPQGQSFALKNISIKIPYGQNIAIIGENGAGKSTLVKLLMRMHDPTEGQITINGIDIKSLPEDVLLLLFSTLMQHFGKFYLTIRENLEIGAGKKLDDYEYIHSLKKSNAWNYIMDFKSGIDQQLGPQYKNGIDLSGGQWQQLAIARAYLKKAPVLILDEPTSAIDAKAEMEIFDRLHHETKDNTVIFISHRFSTIKDAQRILVVDKGKIIEDGSHCQLMNNKGKYSQLYSIQAERYVR